MAGIIHKIEEKLGMGGKKEDEKHGEVKKTEHGYGSGDHHKQPEHGYGSGDHHKQPEAEHKEGLVEKIKDKIHGGDAEGADAKKKKKKDKKKHGEGHDHDHGSSSSSDSD
ncbi:protein SRC1-like [Salvia splendens]|uniref:protein SRC1-like n=1 Tax=Salvia splendens TaxID=180675 RepID=UPI001C26B6AE|nr:protein SRC1-like [Salvia splendens]